MARRSRRGRPQTQSGAAPQAAFPSRLTAQGRTLVDENGFVMPTLRGWNIHTAAWGQATYDQMAALDTRAVPGRFIRMVIHWDSFQPTNGTSVDTSTVTTYLDPSIARAITAGFYVQLEVHLNVNRIPTWATTGLDETDKFYNHGQWFTEYLANRYGNPASPQYSKAIMGFGLNEPPVNNTTMNSAAGSVPYLETRQAAIWGWMRAFAPNWIGFMAWSYASGTPLYEGPGEDTSKTDANPAHGAYVNCIIDLHDYATRQTTEQTTDTGRQFNGGIYTVGNGGPSRGPGDDVTYTSTATHRQQHLNFIKPYKDFCVANGLPLMIGEWGWTPITNVYASGGAGQATSGELAFIDDKQIAWADASPAIEAHWLYAESTGDEWAARPAGAWRPSVLDWMGQTVTSGATFVSDVMSGTAGVNLISRTGETGATWSTLTDRTGHKISSAGRCYGERPGGAADDAMTYASGVPATADYDVQGTVVQVSATAAIGPMGRIDTAAKTGYVAYFDAGTGTYKLDKIVAGAYTNLGSYVAAANTLMLRMRGSTISVLIGGVSRISVTDTAITAAGRAGVWSYGIATDTTGAHLDNFVATNA